MRSSGSAAAGGMLAAAVLYLATPAEGAVYRCQVDGRMTYTDRPCATGAQPHVLPELSTVPSEKAPDLSRQHDERLERERESRARDDAAWLESHTRRKEKEARMEAAISARQVIKGMSADQVRRALGSPDEVERFAQGERWTYGSGRQKRTVDLEGGVVVATGGRK